ncbi:hypothetical protein [Neisseria meningitidis]|uniref:hypothetical protein n=1 Tax=Neisseria meningitidis TaxID=487 RepID=UPI001E3109B4|nr:hypothetical protein [Neisseria meningitidis]
MNIIGKLKEAASYFLTKLIGENPSNEQVNRALIQMPNVRPIHTYPRPDLETQAWQPRNARRANARIVVNHGTGCVLLKDDWAVVGQKP